MCFDCLPTFAHDKRPALRVRSAIKDRAKSAKKRAKKRKAQSKRKRKGIPKNVDREVYLRAGGKCERCGKGPKEVPLHIHHVNPHARGGADDFDNYALLCQGCNESLGASTQWKPERSRPRPSLDVVKSNEQLVERLGRLVGKKKK